MKRPALNLVVQTLLLALVVALVFWALSRAHDLALASWLGPHLERATEFYEANRIGAISLFCLAHLICSATGLPGGCTALNMLSGAVFGFWLGCAIVYPITMLSSAVVYFAGSRLSRVGFLSKYQATAELMRAKLESHDFLFFVSLRLSPLLPFGALNLLAGFLRIPKKLYFSSTLLGIFFDVTLLNNLGAALRIRNGASIASETSLGISFFALLCLFLWLRRMSRRLRDSQPKAEGIRA